MSARSQHSTENAETKFTESSKATEDFKHNSTANCQIAPVASNNPVYAEDSDEEVDLSKMKFMYRVGHEVGS